MPDGLGNKKSRIKFSLPTFFLPIQLFFCITRKDTSDKQLNYKGFFTMRQGFERIGTV
jgi:hypothetical protein